MSRLYPILSAPCGVLRDVRVIVATTMLLAGLAAPAQAAVTMAPLKPCYVSDGDLPTQRERILVHATGFSPLADLTLQIDGATVATGMADAFGEANATVPAPFEGRNEHDFTLAIFENQNLANSASATSRVSDLAVTLRPRRARPRSPCARGARARRAGCASAAAVSPPTRRCTGTTCSAARCARPCASSTGRGRRAASSPPAAGRSPCASRTSATGRCRWTSSAATPRN